MTLFIQFAVLGLGLGAAYALLAQGLVVIQTGSGVINFAHGAMAMVGGFTYWQLSSDGWSFAPAFITAVAVVTALSVVIYLFVMRPLRDFSALTRVIATLAILLTIEAAAYLKWGDLPRYVPAYLPSNAVALGGGVFLGADKLIGLGIAVAITAALWGIYRFTVVGLAIRAGAENDRGVAALGWSGQGLATLTWAAGGALAGTAGVLLAPLASLDVVNMTLLVIPALAAALAGGFVSFPLTLAGAVAIGIGQSLLANYVHVTGVVTALPFALIIVFLVIRGQSLPVRGATSTLRLPELGTGIVRWKPLVGVTIALTALSVFVFSDPLVVAITTSMAWAIVLLSVIVLMGFTGQLDLAPLAWGGLAALIAGRLVRTGVPFEVAMLIGVAGAIPVGLLFGIPALRARGLNLAVVTLGLGVMLHSMVFANPHLSPSGDAGASGVGTGMEVGRQSFFGFDISSSYHPKRYFLLVLAALIVLGLLVASVRRGRVGRRLIAVRTNERAAAALGISVFGSKLYAFALSAAIAAVGGILLGFRYEFINLYTDYDPLKSMLAATHAVIGGIGYTMGALFACQLAFGGIGAWIMNELWHSAPGAWLQLIGGSAAIVFLLVAPNGLFSFKLMLAKLKVRGVKWVVRQSWNLVRRLRGLPPRPKPMPKPIVREPLPEVARELVTLTPATLEVSGLTVRYGGVTAVEDVSLVVRPGQVVGLIGPNGAGKTSLIDAVTGFTPAAAGQVLLDGVRVDLWPAHKRARAGIGRSFQNLELFDSISVRENLQIAGDPRDVRAYVTDLWVAPTKTPLPPLTVLAIRELGLEDVLEQKPVDVSYGVRRLAGIARTFAVGPSVLLLDEPATGLSDSESMDLARVVRALAHDWGLGILVVEHHMSFVMSVCDRIVVLDFGHEIAQGTPSEIRADPAVIAAYLGQPEPADLPAERALETAR